MKKNYPLIGFLGFVAVVVIGVGIYLVLRTSAQPEVAAPIPSTYSMADVAAASTTAKCWAAIDGSVYDFTVFAKTTPSVLSLCGTNASEAVSKLGQGGAASFSSVRIGTLKD